MKVFILSLIFACYVFTAQANTATFVGEDDKSVMTLNVKSVVGSAKEAKNVKKALKKVKGIEDVYVCQESGTVVVKYDKVKMGCCSSISNALNTSGVKFELVSNKENPACSTTSKKECQGSKKSCNKPCGDTKKTL